MGRLHLTLTMAIGVLAVMVICATPATAGTLTTNIQSQVTDAGPILNYDPTASKALVGTGFGGFKQSGAWRNFFISYDSGTSDFVTIIQADISALVGTTINTATLEWVFRNDFNGGATHQHEISSFATTGTVGGSGIAINAVPGGAIQTAVFNTAVGNFTSNSIDITAMVQERATAGADWLGLYLEPVGNAQQYSSVSGGNADAAQVWLRVDFASAATAPLPSAAWAGLGLMGLLGVIRRTRRKTTRL